MYYCSDYESAGAFKNALANNALGDSAGHETYAEYCNDWLKRLRVKAKADVEANAGNPPPYSFILCDEAAGLVDPRTGEGHANHWVGGSQAMAWRKPRGPAAAHLILKSRLSVFFIDDVQGFQQQETTSRETIHRLANQLGAHVTEHALQGVQFRVAGSAALIDWFDDTLGMPKCRECRKDENDKVHDPVQPGHHAFARLVPTPDLREDQMRMAFQIVTHEQLPNEVNQLRQAQLDALNNGADRRGTRAARVLAGYAWDWDSADIPASLDSEAVLLADRQPAPVDFRWIEPDRGPEFNMGIDLQHQDESDAEQLTDRFFKDGNPPSVRCAYPLTARGRDFDHVLVLWGRDFYWDDYQWRVEPQLMFGHPQIRTALANHDDPRHGVALQAAPRALGMAYRILLTRGMKTVRVWIEHEPTRVYVQQQWDAFLQRAGA